MTEVFHIPPLNSSHLYPVIQLVTKTIIEDGYQCLDDVKKLLEKDNLDDGEWISCAAYHASIEEPPETCTISIIHVAIVYEVFHQPNYGLAYNENSPCHNQVFES